MVTLSSFTDSGLFVTYVGQWVWQRPHSVQEYTSSAIFHDSSSAFWMPKVSEFSRSIFSGRYCGSRRWKKTSGSPVITWKCLPSGRKFRNTRICVRCAHHDTWPTVHAVSGDAPTSR